MATIKQGKDLILLFRELDKNHEEAGWVLAFQTEHSIKISVDVESTNTKDGVQQTPKAVEYDASCTALMASDRKQTNELKHAVLQRKMFEFWELDKEEVNEEGKHAATYYQGYLTEFDPSANVDGAVEVSMSMAFNGIGKDGWATFDAEQQAIADYEFEDTTIK